MKKRWLQAQKAEYHDWKDNKIRGLELKEIEKKYQSFLKKISSEIGVNRNWKVLDLGCGPTCISRFLPSAQKIGLDPLAGKLGLKGKLVAGVKILSGKAEKTPFDNNNFDLIICRNVIDHTENSQQTVFEASRVLIDKGYFILAVYVYPKPIAWLKILSEKIPFLKNIEHPFTFTIKSFKKLVDEYFVVQNEFVIHTGYHPNDYGKIDEKISRRTILQKLAIFINYKIFREKWFVKEYCLLLRKK